MPRVAGIIVNLVPYHHARWEAYARLAGIECHLVELTDRDAFKVLEFSATASYQRHTLFPRNGSETLSSTSLRRAMAAKLDVIRPNVVCVSGWALPVSLAALEWAATNRVPAVLLSESNEFDESRSAHKEWLKRRIVGLCSAGLAGGTPQADYLAKLGLPRETIFKGYDVVDNAYFAQGAQEARSRQSEVGSQRTEDGEQKSENGGQSSEVRGPWSVVRSPVVSSQPSLPSSPFFLACARFGEKKNLPRLIEAYALYRKRAESREQSVENGIPPTALPSPISHLPSPISGPAPGPAPPSALRHPSSVLWSLVLLGDGEKRAEIEATIARLGVGNSVYLLGAKSYAEMPDYYGLAAAFIHASTTEQWGLVVNEAMASGLPVLVSNRCGCAKDLVQEGVNGFTFDPYNVDQLAELMFQISAFQLFRLSAFGSASTRLIADWGPERFASGLKQAVECALRVGPSKASLVQRLILKLITHHASRITHHVSVLRPPTSVLRLKTLCIMDSVSRSNGGIFEAERRLQQSLKAQPGVDVQVVGLRDHHTESDRAKWQPLNPTVHVVRGPQAFGFAPGLLDTLLHSDADLAYCAGLWKYPSLAALRWSRRTGKPMVVAPHGMLDSWALQNSGLKKQIAGWLFQNAQLRQAACIRALCEAEAQSIRAFGLKNPIAIIPNGIDLPGDAGQRQDHKTTDYGTTGQGQRGAESGERRMEKGEGSAGGSPGSFSQPLPWTNMIPPGQKVLLFLSRIHPKKGLVNLLRAWAVLRKTEDGRRKTEEWVLAIAGWDQGGHEAELKRLATELGLAWADGRDQRTEDRGQRTEVGGQRSEASGSTSDLRSSIFHLPSSPSPPRPSLSVLFTGPLHGEDKRAALGGAEAFVLPSFSEGFSMAVLEAAGAGLPVLLTPQCNFPELAKVGGAVEVSPDAAGCEAGLRQLLALTDTERQTMGRRGRDLVARDYTWSRVAEQMFSVYRWLLDGGPPPPCVRLT